MWLYAYVILCACVTITQVHVCKERCVCAYVSCVFFHVIVVQNYKHMKLHIFSKIACVFCGQHTCATHVSCLSCSWFVPYMVIFKLYNFKRNKV